MRGRADTVILAGALHPEIGGSPGLIGVVGAESGAHGVWAMDVEPGSGQKNFE